MLIANSLNKIARFFTKYKLQTVGLLAWIDLPAYFGILVICILVLDDGLNRKSRLIKGGF